MNDYPAFSRERRPFLVELAAALLIVGGVAQILLRVGALAQGFQLPVFALALGFGLDSLAIMTGLLIRAGVAWVVCVNIVAVLAFLDFRSLVLDASLPAGLFLALDSIALVAVVRHRTWFRRDRAAERRGRTAERSERRRTARVAQGWTADESDDAAGVDPRPGRG